MSASSPPREKAKRTARQVLDERKAKHKLMASQFRPFQLWNDATSKLCNSIKIGRVLKEEGKEDTYEELDVIYAGHVCAFRMENAECLGRVDKFRVWRPASSKGGLTGHPRILVKVHWMHRDKLPPSRAYQYKNKGLERWSLEKGGQQGEAWSIEMVISISSTLEHEWNEQGNRVTVTDRERNFAGENIQVISGGVDEAADGGKEGPDDENVLVMGGKPARKKAPKTPKKKTPGKKGSASKASASKASASKTSTPKTPTQKPTLSKIVKLKHVQVVEVASAVGLEKHHAYGDHPELDSDHDAEGDPDEGYDFQAAMDLDFNREAGVMHSNEYDVAPTTGLPHEGLIDPSLMGPSSGMKRSASEAFGSMFGDGTGPAPQAPM